MFRVGRAIIVAFDLAENFSWSTKRISKDGPFLGSVKYGSFGATSSNSKVARLIGCCQAGNFKRSVMSERWLACPSSRTMPWVPIFAALALGCGEQRPTFDFSSVAGYQLLLYDETDKVVTSRSARSGKRELKSKTPFSVRGRIFSPVAIDKVLVKVISFERPDTPHTIKSSLAELVPGEPGHYAYKFALEGVPRPGPYLVQVMLVGDPLSELSFFGVP